MSEPTPPRSSDQPTAARPAKRRRVRVGAKALVIHDGHLLVTANRDHAEGHNPEAFYLLPGGGIEFGEATSDAVRRECLEETSIDVEVGELACIRDYIGASHEFSHWDSGFHQVDLMFWATPTTASQVPRTGEVLDTWQTGARWVPLDQLDDLALYPAALKQWLRLDPSARPLYLGDVN